MRMPGAGCPAGRTLPGRLRRALRRASASASARSALRSVRARLDTHSEAVLAARGEGGCSV